MPRQRSNHRVLIAIIGLGAGLPWLVAALSGNLTIPHYDAWSYSRSAQVFARSGQLQLFGWGRMTLVGQIVMLGPLGRWLLVQQTATALLAAVAIFCVYDLTQHAIGSRRALLAAAIVAAWPGFGSLATSFMTDMPALAGSLACLSVGRQALRRDSRVLFWLSLAIGFWAFAIREQAIAAPAAVLLCAALPLAGGKHPDDGEREARARRLSARQLQAATIVGILAVAALLQWRGSLPGGSSATAAWPTSASLGDSARLLVSGFFTLALVCGPALLLCVRPRRWSQPQLLVAVIAAALGLWCLHAHSTLFSGDYLTAYGSTPVEGSTRLFPSVMVNLLSLLALLAGIALAGELAHSWRRFRKLPVLAAFTVFSAAGTVLDILFSLGSWDRYLIVLVPGVLAVLLSGEQRHPAADSTAPAASTTSATASRTDLTEPAAPTTGRRQLAAVLGLAALAALTATLALNLFAVDRARWNAARAAMTGGGSPATRVDAGIAWDGWQSTKGVIHPWGSAAWLDYGKLESSPPCAVVELSPLSTAERNSTWKDFDLRDYRGPRPTLTLWRAVHYRHLLITGSATIYIYATHAPGCMLK